MLTSVSDCRPLGCCRLHVNLEHFSKLEPLPRTSSDLYQLDHFTARTFDHDGARISKLIGPA